MANLEFKGAKKEAALVVDIGGTTTEVGMLLYALFPSRIVAFAADPSRSADPTASHAKQLFTTFTAACASTFLCLKSRGER